WGDRIRHWHGPSDTRPLFSWRGDPPQRDHRRSRRSLSTRQFLPADGWPGRLRRCAGQRLPAETLEFIQTGGNRSSRCGSRHRADRRDGGEAGRSAREVTVDNWTIALDLFGFWIALTLLAYVYVGYPLLAWVRAALREEPLTRIPSEPFVTVIIVAYNEAQRIERRILNLLSLDYPRAKLEIVVASDGSTD